MKNRKLFFYLLATSSIFTISLGLFFINAKVTQAYDATLTNKLSGRILLQVQSRGEAWYINPSNNQRYYLGRPTDAYNLMRSLGLGIKHSELATYLNSTFPSRLSGKILLDVESKGEAYYVNPLNLKGYYLGRPTDAYNVMRSLGLGITNSNLTKIQVNVVNTDNINTGAKTGNSNLPPAASISACTGKALNTTCQFTDNDGIATGVCDNKPGVLACRKDQTTASNKSNNQPTISTKPTNNQNSTSTQQNANQYSLEQAMSDNAQLSTIAFSGLAFITGSAGADSFFPPGKVADFNGFQYMRDVDTAGYGHNTTFLSRVANNVLYILNDAQKAKLVALAEEQAPIYTNFAYNRFPLMNAFRRQLEGDVPSGSTGLSSSAVSAYTSNLYKLDADLSYNRALVVGEIINSFTDTQKAYLAKMEFDDYSTWPVVEEDANFKKSMTNTEFVAVMTYASELFSWYKGSITADVYFCPERHGTYFGGFYMKDYPAMNDPNYFISTATTGDSGQEFLNILNTSQRALITGIIAEQKSALTEIAQIRTTVSTELRKAIAGGTVNKELVYSLIERYGELDGQMSALYAYRFAAVNKTLTDTQRAALVKLRNLTVVPQGAYMFSTPTAMPEISSTNYMFGDNLIKLQ